MREFQVINNLGFTEDAIGSYQQLDEQGLQEKMEFIAQYAVEKDIAKHYPGQFFHELKMNLTGEFKKALSEKAEKLYRNKFNANGGLSWIAATKMANHSILPKDLPTELQHVIQCAKVFSNS